jgi:hypothetical protein
VTPQASGSLRSSPLDMAAVAAQAQRLFDAVERGDVVADDASGRRMVTLWRVLANGDAARPQAVDDET